MTERSQTSEKRRQNPLALLLLSTAVLTGGGLLGLTKSAQAHHGGRHSIEVNQAGEAYENLGPNWNSLMNPGALAGRLSLLGLSTYFVARHYTQKPKA